MTRWAKPEIPFSDAPHGLCRWCGEAILKPDGNQDTRRRWHEPCVEEYRFYVFPSVANYRLEKRDGGVCQACGLDTGSLSWQAFQQSGSYEEWHRMLSGRGLPAGRSFWEADHVVPLCEGGEHSMDNLWTLCVPCHRTKTGHEASLRARKPGMFRAHVSSRPGPDRELSDAELRTMYAEAWDEFNAQYGPPGDPEGAKKWWKEHLDGRRAEST